MNKQIISELFQKKYSGKCPHLCKTTILSFLTDSLHILFPQMGQKNFNSEQELELALKDLKNKLVFILNCLHKELDAPEEKHAKVVEEYFSELMSLEKMLTEDARFMGNEDPASKSIDEVIICYPGFFAIATYRVAHFFYQKEIPLFPRIMSEFAHEKTGIDIHPGAKIESPFFIDHGTGIVIGETTEIGKGCKLFQGVTLGALSVKRDMKDSKRHPTIKDNCLIYSNTTILGGETIIGENTTIGGNVWITESIPANSAVYRKHDFERESKKSRV